MVFQVFSVSGSWALIPNKVLGWVSFIEMSTGVGGGRTEYGHISLRYQFDIQV